MDAVPEDFLLPTARELEEADEELQVVRVWKGRGGFDRVSTSLLCFSARSTGEPFVSGHPGVRNQG